MRDWFVEFFQNPAWLAVQRSMFDEDSTAADAAQVAALLGVEDGDAVLDVPCGEGRLARALAARGLTVTGVDQSEVLLEDARLRAAEAGVSIDLVRADMRHIDIVGKFDAAVNFWGSFGYFDTDGDYDHAKAVFDSLKPGGRFLIDCVSTEVIFPRFQPKGWFEAGGIRVLEDRTYDPVTGRLEVAWTFFKDGVESRGSSRIRLYSCPELCSLLAHAGFATFRAYGDLDGAPFAVGSGRLILIATR